MIKKLIGIIVAVAVIVIVVIAAIRRDNCLLYTSDAADD